MLEVQSNDSTIFLGVPSFSSLIRGSLLDERFNERTPLAVGGVGRPSAGDLVLAADSLPEKKKEDLSLEGILVLNEFRGAKGIEGEVIAAGWNKKNIQQPYSAFFAYGASNGVVTVSVNTNLASDSLAIVPYISFSKAIEKKEIELRGSDERVTPFVNESSYSTSRIVGILSGGAEVGVEVYAVERSYELDAEMPGTLYQKGAKMDYTSSMFPIFVPRLTQRDKTLQEIPYKTVSKPVQTELIASIVANYNTNKVPQLKGDYAVKLSMKQNASMQIFSIQSTIQYKIREYSSLNSEFRQNHSREFETVKTPYSVMVRNISTDKEPSRLLETIAKVSSMIKVDSNTYRITLNNPVQRTAVSHGLDNLIEEVSSFQPYSASVASVVGSQLRQASYTPTSASNDNLLASNDNHETPYIDDKGNKVEGVYKVFDAKIKSQDLEKLEVSSRNYLKVSELLLKEAGYNVGVDETVTYRNTKTGKMETGSILIDLDDSNVFYHIHPDGYLPEFNDTGESPLALKNVKEGDYVQITQHRRDLKQIDSKIFRNKNGKKLELCEAESERVNLDYNNEGKTYKDVAKEVVKRMGFDPDLVDNMYESGALNLSAQKSKGYLGGDVVSLDDKIDVKKYASLEIAVNRQNLSSNYKMVEHKMAA